MLTENGTSQTENNAEESYADQGLTDINPNQAERNFKFNSLEEVIETQTMSKDWEVSFGSINEGRLKAESREWNFREGNKIKSLTDSIRGQQETARHNEILEGLYNQGWAAVEYWHEETHKTVKEIYFADAQGNISFRAYDFKPEKNNTTHQDYLDLMDDDDYVSGIKTKKIDPVTISLNQNFTFSQDKQEQTEYKETAWDNFWNNLLKPKQAGTEVLQSQIQKPELMDIFGFGSGQEQSTIEALADSAAVERPQPTDNILNLFVPQTSLRLPPEVPTIHEVTLKSEVNNTLNEISLNSGISLKQISAISKTSPRPETAKEQVMDIRHKTQSLTIDKPAKQAPEKEEFIIELAPTKQLNEKTKPVQRVAETVSHIQAKKSSIYRREYKSPARILPGHKETASRIATKPEIIETVKKAISMERKDLPHIEELKVTEKPEQVAILNQRTEQEQNLDTPAQIIQEVPRNTNKMGPAEHGQGGVDEIISITTNSPEEKQSIQKQPVVLEKISSPKIQLAQKITLITEVSAKALLTEPLALEATKPATPSTENTAVYKNSPEVTERQHSVNIEQETVTQQIANKVASYNKAPVKQQPIRQTKTTEPIALTEPEKTAVNNSLLEKEISLQEASASQEGQLPQVSLRPASVLRQAQATRQETAEKQLEVLEPEMAEPEVIYRELKNLREAIPLAEPLAGPEIKLAVTEAAPKIKETYKTETVKMTVAEKYRERPGLEKSIIKIRQEIKALVRTDTKPEGRENKTAREETIYKIIERLIPPAKILKPPEAWQAFIPHVVTKAPAAAKEPASTQRILDALKNLSRQRLTNTVPAGQTQSRGLPVVSENRKVAVDTIMQTYKNLAGGRNMRWGNEAKVRRRQNSNNGISLRLNAGQQVAQSYTNQDALTANRTVIIKTAA